ncbi:MAG TPA: hypothetical protein VNP04_03960 [Alphaproteobacteria bacterium]|nr:hypothetical protein [Alphaproteobacteria bacterium]
MERLEAIGPRPRWVPVSDVEKLEAQCKRLCATVKLYEERHVQLQREHAALMKEACRLLRQLLQAGGKADGTTAQEAKAFLVEHGWGEDDASSCRQRGD